MSAPTSKQRALKAIESLPAEATLDGAIASLVFLSRVESGLQDSDAGRVTSHEEFKRRLTNKAI